MKRVGENQLKKAVTKATKWSFITELVAKIIVPITNAILAHLLAPDAFGVVVTINMVISFADILTESGFGQFLIQHDFKNDKEYSNYIDVAFWCNFVVSILLWLAILLSRNELAKFVGSEGYGVPLTVACLSLPITSFSSIPIAILQKRLDYKSLFYNRLASSLTPLIVSTFLAVIGMGYWSLIIGTLCSHIVRALVLIIRSKWYPHFYFDFSSLRIMFSYSIWILLEASALWACTWGDIFIVSRMLGPYYTGIYKTAQTTVTGILSVITASVNSIVFVSLSKCKNDMVVFRNWFYEYQKTLAIIVVPMGIGIYVFRQFITMILLGNNWMEGAEFLGFWGISMSLVATMGTFCREALRAKGFSKTSLLVQVLHFLFVIPVVIIASNFGFRALTFFRSLAYLHSILLLHIFVKRKLDLSPIKICRNTIWPIVCAVFMGFIGTRLVSCGDVTVVATLVQIGLCIFTYFFVLILSKEYRKRLFGIVKKYMLKKKG